MQQTLGIEASRNILLNEMRAVVDDAGEYVNLRHLQLLVDLMTCRGIIMPTSRQGINRGDNGPLAKMSFEDTTEQIMKAGLFGEVDNLKGVSANIMMGQVVPCGTGNFSVLLDEEVITKNIIEKSGEQEVDTEEVNMEEYLDGSDDEDEYCDDENLDFSFNV
jgi:DNA-directed RNA polymerase II subunit RPB1